MKTAPGASRGEYLYLGVAERGLILDGIRLSGLLKWRNSLYRPGVAGGDRAARSFSRSGLLGRSQAVRQRILIPPFGGSIPPAPATSQCTDFAKQIASLEPELPAHLEIQFAPHLEILCWVRFGRRPMEDVVG